MKLSDRVATWFGGLSAREQRLLGILGVISTLFVVFLFGYTVYNSYSVINTRIARAEELSALLEANKEAIATKLAGTGDKKTREPVPKLTSFLDDISQRKSVPIQNYGGEKSLPTKDKKYTETSMEVRLAKVTLQQIVDFVQEIENADEAAYTKHIEINIPRKDQRDSFDVVITVATYEDPSAKKNEKDKTSDKEDTKDKGEDVKGVDAKGDGAEPTKITPVSGYGAAKGSTKDGAEPALQGLPNASKFARPLPEVKDGTLEPKVETPKGLIGRRPFPFRAGTTETTNEATPEKK
jgi:hypothetical protein